MSDHDNDHKEENVTEFMPVEGGAVTFDFPSDSIGITIGLVLGTEPDEHVHDKGKGNVLEFKQDKE